METKRQASAVLLWFVWTIHCMVANGDEFCPLENSDCSQNGIRCHIVRDPTCAGPSQKKTSHYPGSVTDFTVRPFNLPPDGPANTVAKVDMTWGLPADGTHKYITGFEVRITRHDVSGCFIMNIATNESNWGHHQDYKFSLNCTKLHHNDDGYDISVRSLPRSPHSDKKAEALLKVIQKKEDKDPADCAGSTSPVCWDTHIVVYNDECSRVVRAAFHQAPDDRQISYYVVTLIEKNAFLADRSVNVSKVETSSDSVTFLEGTIHTGDLILPLLNRRIRIIPKGVHCYNNRCRDSLSQAFAVTNGTERECLAINPPTTDPPKISQNVLIGIVVACILVAGALTVIVIICAKKRCCSEDHTPLYPTDGTSSNDAKSWWSYVSGKPLVVKPQKHQKDFLKSFTNSLKRKVILLVYSNDCPLHQNVIGSFATFLGKYACDVIFDQFQPERIRDDKSAWIRDQMTRCDFILLINSEGTYKKAHAFQQHHEFTKYDTQSYLGDMFTPAFNIIQHDILASTLGPLKGKIIMVHLSYTPREFICVPLQLLQEKANYELMSHFDELISHIHASPASVYNQEFDNTHEGKSLTNAIDMASTYLRRNPRWFLDTNGQASPLVCWEPILYNEFQSSPGNQLPQPNYGPYEQIASSSRNSSMRNSSMRGPTATPGFPSAMIPPVNPDDITTIDGSISGDQIFDINNEMVDSGFGNLNSYSSPHFGKQMQGSNA